VIFYTFAALSLLLKVTLQEATVSTSPDRANFMLIAWMMTDLPVIGLMIWMYYKSYSDYYMKNSLDSSPLLQPKTEYKPLRE
jgi:hypothetical protein